MLHKSLKKLVLIPTIVLIMLFILMLPAYADPNSTSLNNIVIFVRFSGESEFTDPAQYYQNTFNNDTISLRSYFQEVSYNKLTINSTFYPITSGTTVISYQDSHSRNYYLPYNAVTNPEGYEESLWNGFQIQREHELVKAAINSVALQIPPSLNIDYNNDGKVDNVCLVVSGSSSSGFGSTLGTHMYKIEDPNLTINEKKVYCYNIIPRSTPIGSICHEMFHSLGAPDLYHYKNNGFTGVNGWDIMGTYNAPTPHMGAYMKYRYGHWIDYLPEITQPGTYILNPLTSAIGNCYKIKSPNSENEFFVVEFRKKTGLFESSVPGSGLVVYRIDPTLSGNDDGPPDEVYIFREDGSLTTDGDVYKSYFSSEAGRTAIDFYTNPSLFLYNKGAGGDSGIRIYNIGSAAGDTISFQVEFTKLSKPTFSVAGGTFNLPQTVAISCETDGVTIHYTTDGSIPTEWSPIYSAPFIITNHTTVLRAKAFKGNYTSDINTATYIISDAYPESPHPYSGNFKYTWTYAAKNLPEWGASIQLTFDPRIELKAGDGIFIEEGPFNFVYSYDTAQLAGQTLTFRAPVKIRLESNDNDEAYGFKVTAVTEVSNTATPTFSIEGGYYSSAQNVIISCATPGAVIRYTTDGTEPYMNSQVINSGSYVTIETSRTLKAKAWYYSAPSLVKSADYNINTVVEPTFSIGDGVYGSVQSIVINCATPGAVIHYTINSADPVESDLEINSGDAVMIGNTSTLKARAFKPEMAPSPIKSAIYQIIAAVAEPTFSLDGGSFNTPQSVVINCATPGAVIHYTINGKEPTENDPVTNSGTAVPISFSLTLKAKAWKTGLESSMVKSAVYDITSVVAQPAFSIEAGNYPTAQYVVITCATLEAVIHYTTNGMIPTASDPTINSGSIITVGSSMVLKAKAWKTGLYPSIVKSAAYSIGTLVAQPSFSVEGGTYDTAQSVIISCDTPNTVIHFTTNGVDPTESDPVIASGTAVTVDGSLTLKAKAWRTGYEPSPVKSATYIIGNQVAQPSFSIGEGNYNSPQNVVITCVTPDAIIHYTINGMEPSENDPVIPSGSSVTVDRSLTVKTKAWKSGYDPSVVRSISYTIQAATPAFSLESGSHYSNQNVVITCATQDAVIHYTVNGQEPTESDPTVSSGSSVEIDRSLTLKAKAWKSGLAPSAVKSVIYTIQAAMPYLSHGSGSYSSAINVTTDCATPDAVIHYTLNGMDPTESDPVIASGETITVDYSLTLKVKAWKPGLTPSMVRSEAYTILQVATPTFSIEGGTYDSARNVVINCAIPDAVIHYNTNGADPRETDPVITPGDTITVDYSLTLKAQAWRTGLIPSLVKTAVFRIGIQLDSPTFSIQGGTYTYTQYIVINSNAPNATIHYTTNGQDPTENDPVINCGSTVTVDRSLTLKAKAWETGFEPSNVMSSSYVITGIVETPTYSLAPGAYTSAQNVVIDCATPDVTISYTTDGSEPTLNNGTIINPGTAVVINITLTLKAKAFKTDWIPSNTNTASYTIQIVATPIFNLAEGSYAPSQNIIITCSTPGAVIHYTTNGLDPTENDPQITSGSTVLVESDTLLKAKAWKANWCPSDIQNAVYTITQVATPRFTPDGDSFVSSFYVTISCATPGAEIHYTIDGTDPAITSPAIASGGTLSVNGSLTLKAKAWKSGLTTSTVKSAVYSIEPSMAAGLYHSVMVKSDGTVWSWGDNSKGELGDGTYVNKSLPVPVSGLTNVKKVAAGTHFSLALQNDGTVWAWGDNSKLQLGISNISRTCTPTKIDSLTDVKTIVSGNTFSMVLKNDGTVWVWGATSTGQLGNGTNGSSLMPVQVNSLHGIIAIAVSQTDSSLKGHCLALKNDGTVWAWGCNSSGQLGNGTDINSNVPIQVSGLTDIIGIGAGAKHSLALKSDGTVWAWGYNDFGQLGNGTTNNSFVPVQVSDLTGIKAITTGQYFNFALKNDGTVFGWGNGCNGSLGTGNWNNRNTPILISGLSDGVKVIAGYGHTLAIKSDNTIWGWGLNNYGQLGTGTNVGSSEPIQVSGITF